MTDNSLWQKIKTLVDCDKKIAALSQEITHLKQAIEQDHALITQRDNLIEQKKRLLLDEKKTINLNELQVNELKEKEDRKRVQLDKMSAQKEYRAFEREIETLSRQRGKLEETVVQQWFTLETIKNELEAIQAGREEFITKTERDIQSKTEQEATLEQKLLDATNALKVAEKNVPTEWLTQYGRMKQSVQDPIVAAINGSCSACFYSIPHHELSKLKKEQLIICHSCYRFLYLETMPEKLND